MTINPTNLTATAKLTFAEDFNQFRTWNGVNGLDVTANVLPPLGAGNPGTSGYVNAGEKQWYVNPDYRPANGNPALPNPFSVQNGVLTIEARLADQAIRSTIEGQTYTSGVISTYHEFSQTYGYFEMRAQLPAGQGLWPAFWLLPVDKSWPPEIDVVEQLGKDPSKIYTTVHSKVGGEEQLGGNHFQTTAGHSVANTSQGFHTYGVDWQKDTITWYFDGQEIYRAATPADANKPMYMIANLAVGGNWPGQPDGTTPFPAQMKIDYLRAYDALPFPTPPKTGALSLKVAQDVFGEDAKFVVKVDGVQAGGVHYAHASRGAGAWDTINLAGDFSKSSQVVIEFVNDANDGRGHDRNLYVQSVAIDGRVASGGKAILDAGVGSTADGTASLWSNGKATLTLPASAPSEPAKPTTTGALSLKVAQDVFGEDAKFVVKVDGVQAGGVHSAHASRGAGAWDTVNLAGDFSKSSQVVIEFVNDANDGRGHDRNLYVGSIALDGRVVSGGKAILDAGVGSTADGSAALWSNGKATFDLSGRTVPDTLHFRVAQDIYGEDARYILKVDGKQVGDVRSAHASHAAGAWDDVTLQANLANAQKLTISFLNDANDGRGADRNLYVADVSVNGHAIGAAQTSVDPGAGAVYQSVAGLWSNGSLGYTLAGNYDLF